MNNNYRVKFFIHIYLFLSTPKEHYIYRYLLCLSAQRAQLSLSLITFMTISRSWDIFSVTSFIVKLKCQNKIFIAVHPGF